MLRLRISRSLTSDKRVISAWWACSVLTVILTSDIRKSSPVSTFYAEDHSKFRSQFAFLIPDHWKSARRVASQEHRSIDNRRGRKRYHKVSCVLCTWDVPSVTWFFYSWAHLWLLHRAGCKATAYWCMVLSSLSVNWEICTVLTVWQTSFTSVKSYSTSYSANSEVTFFVCWTSSRRSFRTWITLIRILPAYQAVY